MSALGQPTNLSMLAVADWIEVLAAVIIFLITGIAQWVQQSRRRRRGLPPKGLEEAFPEAAETNRPPVIVTRDRKRPTPDDWEEELRRMLQGEPYAPPPKPPPLPPAPPRPAVLLEQPGLQERSLESGPSLESDLAPMRESTGAYRRGATVEELVSKRLAGAGRFESAGAALRRAGRLHDSVGQRLRHSVSLMHAHHRPAERVRRPMRAGSVTSVLHLLRSPESTRQLILASVILGRPKGFEP